MYNKPDPHFNAPLVDGTVEKNLKNENRSIVLERQGRRIEKDFADRSAVADRIR
jgi:hypothetical protein